MGIGRPTVVTPEIAAEILNRLSEGELMVDILAAPGMPSRTSLRRLCERDETFRMAYAGAREDQACAMAEAALKICERATAENAQVARLRFDAARWMVSKIMPRLFGDKVTAEVTGADGGPVLVDRPLVPGEAKALIAEILAEAEGHCGLPLSDDLDEASRIAAIERTGVPVPPRMYDLLVEIPKKPRLF
ncbi:MAG TPA: hypothetical protein VIE66_04380 [Methylocella sp.]|jgi:hypothetical protein